MQLTFLFERGIDLGIKNCMGYVGEEHCWITEVLKGVGAKKTVRGLLGLIKPFLSIDTRIARKYDWAGR